MLSSDTKGFLVGLIIVSGYLGGFLLANLIPRIVKAAHVRRQNELMTQCRALYIAAVEAIHLGADADASDFLRRIRTREGKWKIGYSIYYRLALACWAIAIAFLACIISRLVMVAAVVLIEGRPLSTISLDLSSLAVVALVSLSALLHGFVAWVDAWTQPWIVDDCGNRLVAYISSPRSMAKLEVQMPEPKLRHGLTDLELFGLRPSFSLRELDRARRRLATEFHPDRWLGGKPSLQSTAEESMKLVNAAYDRLRGRLRT